jgi:hypothetical protein
MSRDVSLSLTVPCKLISYHGKGNFLGDTGKSSMIENVVFVLENSLMSMIVFDLNSPEKYWIWLQYRFNHISRT